MKNKSMEVFIMKLKVMTYNIAGGRDYSIEPWGKNDANAFYHMS